MDTKTYAVNLKAMTDAPKVDFDLKLKRKGRVLGVSAKKDTEVDLSSLILTDENHVLKEIFDQDAVGELKRETFPQTFRLSKDITNINHMFEDYAYIKQVDVSKFNTSNVTDMSYVFNYCSTLEEIDVSSWDTSSVLDFSQMFAFCSNLKRIHGVIDMSALKFADKTSCWNMFRNCTQLEHVKIRNPFPGFLDTFVEKRNGKDYTLHSYEWIGLNSNNFEIVD